jgi:hypothetical protein
MTDGICLRGLDGSNPLAFLAALGVLRGLTLESERRAETSGRSDDGPGEPVRMWWTQERGVWTPWVGQPGLEQGTMIELLCDAVRREACHPTLLLGDNFACTPEEYRAHAEMLHRDGQSVDLLSALGTDGAVDDDGLCIDTAFRTMRGAGHQHFLKTMRSALASTSAEHIERTVMRSWDYADPVKSMSLRIDPLDDRRYAHQWTDPSGDPTRAERGGMTGATALAVLGLAMYPVVVSRGAARTVGFRSSREHGVEWTWPIWAGRVALGVAGAMLALPELQTDKADRRVLGRRGIVDVSRSRPITNGKFRNFAPAESV